MGFRPALLGIDYHRCPQRHHDLREVFNALRWHVRAGAPWRMVKSRSLNPVMDYILMGNFYSLRALILACAMLTSMAQACPPPSPLPAGVKSLTMPEVVQNAYTKSDTVFIATVKNVVQIHKNEPNQVKATLKPVQIYKGDPSGLLDFEFEVNSMGCGHIKPQQAGNSVMYFIQRFPSGVFHFLTLNLTDSSGAKINIQENAKIIEQVRRLSATNP